MFTGKNGFYLCSAFITHRMVLMSVIIIYLFIFSSGTLSAQQFPIGISLPPGYTNAGVTDVSGDGRILVGWVDSSTTIDAFRVIDTTFQILPFLPNASINRAVAVARDTMIITGYSYVGLQRKGWRLAPGGGIEPLGTLPGDNASDPADISGDGTVIVGKSSGRTTIIHEAYRWVQGQGMAGLGALSQTHFASDAQAVSADGSVIAGTSYNNDEKWRAFRWTQGTGIQNLGVLQGYEESRAFYISDDGQVIAGVVSNTNGTNEIFRWVSGVITGLGNYGGGSWSAPITMSPDGSIIVAISSQYQTVVWDIQNGWRTLEDAWMNDYGVQIQGWDLQNGNFVPAGISVDDSTWAGYGYNLVNEAQVWRAKFTSGKSLTIISPVENEVLGISTDFNILWASIGVDSLRIEFSTDGGENYFLIAASVPADSNLYRWNVPGTPSDSCILKLTDTSDSDVFTTKPFRIGEALILTEPTAGEIWIAGEQNTIRWVANGVDTINILFSQDYENGGGAFDTLVMNYPAQSGSYVWDTPDSILSTRCGILLEDAHNPVVFTFPDEFKIKGYVLTRYKPDSTYEAFDPAIHGWNFGNTTGNMWPQSWWIQFNYQTGLDPVTGEIYPPIYRNLQPFLFPDWPLFVRAFGIEQCYLVTPQNTYKYLNGAMIYWMSNLRNWGGSCHGFALSSFLAFDRKDIFRARFPELPDFQNLSEVSLEDSVRMVINQLWLQVKGMLDLDYRHENVSKSPSVTLQEIKDMLLAENGEPSPIYFADLGPEGGAHSVSPYRVEKDDIEPNIEHVYVYDNNYPGNGNLKISVDIANETWEYNPYNWGGESHFYLNLPASLALSNSVLPYWVDRLNNPKIPVSIVPGIKIYNSEADSVMIWNGSGERIGYNRNGVIEEVTDAIALIPVTGYPHSPIGYSVPRGEYEVEINGYSGQTTNFTAMSDSLILTYSYTDADSLLIDHLYIDSGLSISFENAQTKTANFQAITVSDGAEHTFGINDLAMTNNDSLHFEVFEQNDLEMINSGSSKNYNLNLRIVSTAGESLFEYDNINLDSISSHKILPVWDDLYNQPVKILIDIDNNGSIDDSLLVHNQLTGISDDPVVKIPEKFRVFQNYPNPFNATTTIHYHLPKRTEVTLKIFDITGQEVRTLVKETLDAGEHSVIWNGVNDQGISVSSGIYLYQLKAGNRTESRRMLLLK